MGCRGTVRYIGVCVDWPAETVGASACGGSCQPARGRRQRQGAHRDHETRVETDRLANRDVDCVGPTDANRREQKHEHRFKLAQGQDGRGSGRGIHNV